MSANVSASGSDLELEEALEKWYEATNRRRITLVTAGRSGVGKSTLIGNMLRLTGDDAPKNRHDPSSVTQAVRMYSTMVGGVEVRIIDTPGFAATDAARDVWVEPKSMADIELTSDGEADMLLYCVSILPNTKVDEHDQKIIKKLTRVFGSDIWNHAILVFTFANIVKMMPGNDIPRLVKEYGDKFQLVLRRECPSFSVASMFSCDPDEVRRPPNTIVALPAGLDPNEELVEGMKWDESICMEVLKKCNPDAIPAFLKARRPTPWMIRKALAVGQFVGKVGFAGVCGMVHGVYGGAGVGTIAGIVVGGGVGAAIGEMIGIATGAVGGAGYLGYTMGMKVHSDIQKYEDEQADLEQVQEALRRQSSSK